MLMRNLVTSGVEDKAVVGGRQQPFLFVKRRHGHRTALISATRSGYSENLAAFGTATAEHDTAIFGGHASAKTVGALTF